MKYTHIFPYNSYWPEDISENVVCVVPEDTFLLQESLDPVVIGMHGYSERGSGQ